MKKLGFGEFERMNRAWLSVVIFALCLPSASLGLRALLPQWMQDSFYSLMLRRPSVGSLVTYAFYVVATLGTPMCAIAVGLFAIHLFFKGVPIWLRTAMATWILLAIHGIVTVGHALGR